MKRLIIVVFMFMSAVGLSQGTLTLDDCQKAAALHYPQVKNQEVYEGAYQRTRNILKAAYLPTVSLSAQASWQSSVTALPISFPGISIPEMANDQYKLNLDATQLIYDGGITTYNKQLADVQLRIDNNELATELYKLRQRINELYFNAKLMQKQLAITQTMQKSLESRLSVCQSAYNNGTLTAGQCGILKAEILLLEQRKAESESALRSILKMLTIYTGSEVTEPMLAELAEVSINTQPQLLSRPDYASFDLLLAKATLNTGLLGAAQKPKVTGFAQAGYGRPGLNMLKNDFAPYFMLGARFNWMLWNWKQTRHQQEISDLKSQSIQYAKETFEMNIKLQLAAKNEEIQKIIELLASDEQLIALRSTISAEASSQFDNGVLQSADLVLRLNEEAAAKLNAEVHKLQLNYSKIMYNELIGINN